MQGVILRAAKVCQPYSGLILGNDGIRYTFSLDQWQGDDVDPKAGMRVDFVIRGYNAADIFPIPEVITPPPAKPSPAPSATQIPSASERLPSTSTGRGFKPKWWCWLIAGTGILVTVGVVMVFLLGLFGSSAPPVGMEIARLTHEGRTYTLVEYGKELAIFSDSGDPVGMESLAEAILRSYAWRQVIGEFDIEQLVDVSAKVQSIDERVSAVRNISDAMVSVFDGLDNLEANIPFVGRVSAMEVLRDSFSSVGEAEQQIRTLNSELADLGSHATALVNAAHEVQGVDLSAVSGDRMEILFDDATEAAGDLEGSLQTVAVLVSDVQEPVGRLTSALKAKADTPIIGGALRAAGRTSERYESALFDLLDLVAEVQSEHEELAGSLRGALESAANNYQDDMGRWLARPYDAKWPPEDPDRRAGVHADPASSTPATALRPTSVPPVLTGESQPAPDYTATPVPAPTAEPTPTPPVFTGDKPFELQWSIDASPGGIGASITMVVRMYNLRHAGEHGGISVSFPSLTEFGGSNEMYSSSMGNVEATGYTNGLSNVTFHQPGAIIYHRENDRQFPAEYLLVESDDASWSTSDSRTLTLLITLERGGVLPVLIRSWLCKDGYTDCSRNPASGEYMDQQGWFVEQAWVELPTSSTSTTVTGSVATDRAALAALFDATLGQGWKNNHNWLSDAPVGQWYGVNTSADGRVVELILEENSLSGTIPRELGNLTKLRLLWLSGNYLNGRIPIELAKLTNLESLALSNNLLDGPIPRELHTITNLEVLRLDGNYLSGPIPQELGNLTNLTHLVLDGNELSGTIPQELGRLTRLLYLVLDNNELSGTIPQELGNLTNLRELILRGNTFIGCIPQEVQLLLERYPSIYTDVFDVGLSRCSR